ncbi:MAG: endonuclease V [Candidatus Aenigmarchaeota archaeon]|nr:endonuclease V [Candidatus Aenigmarchaeota archaeon]
MLVDPKILEGLRKVQEGIGNRVILEDRTPSRIRTIGGLDIAYSKEYGYACVVVLDYETFRVIEKKVIKTKIDFPYVSTFLSFREAPSVINVYRMLEKEPDVIMVNGHGIIHPVRAGLASHVGVMLEKPSIGVAQNKLVGEFKVPSELGDFNQITFEGSQIGWVLKTMEGFGHIFISPGHKVSLERSLGITKHCIRENKLPEPIRIAHYFAEKEAHD